MTKQQGSFQFSCCQCLKNFKRYSKGSTSITKYGNKREDSPISTYISIDLCPKCSRKFKNLKWKNKTSF